jgi:hypothetical protein
VVGVSGEAYLDLEKEAIGMILEKEAIGMMKRD